MLKIKTQKLTVPHFIEMFSLKKKRGDAERREIWSAGGSKVNQDIQDAFWMKKTLVYLISRVYRT